MNHIAELRLELALWNLQFSGSILDQNAPHLRGVQSEHLEIGGNAGAARCVHYAESGIAINLVVKGRLLDAHRRPVEVELLGDDQRKRRARTLPHFRGRGCDRNRVVRIELDPRGNDRARRIGIIFKRGRRGKRDREAGKAFHHLASGRNRRAFYEIDIRHAQAPFAARSIARTIPGYVPQRQILPLM
jgi:hypothetical protein